MATDNAPASTSEKFSLVGLTALLVVVALFVIVSTKAGTRGVGCLMIAGALKQQFDGCIEYG